MKTPTGTNALSYNKPSSIPIELCVDRLAFVMNLKPPQIHPGFIENIIHQHTWEMEDGRCDMCH